MLSKSFGSVIPIHISFSVLLTVPVPSLLIDPSAASNTRSERSSSTLWVIVTPVTSSCLTMFVAGAASYLCGDLLPEYAQASCLLIHRKKKHYFKGVPIHTYRKGVSGVDQKRF